MLLSAATLVACGGEDPDNTDYCMLENELDQELLDQFDADRAMGLNVTAPDAANCVFQHEDEDRERDLTELCQMRNAAAARCAEQ